MSEPAVLWLPWPAVCFENRPTGHRTNTDNPAKWSQTCLLAERRSPGHRAVIFNSRVQTMLASVAPPLRAHLPSHTTKPRCVCTRRQTQQIFVSRPRAAKCGCMRTRGSRAFPTCAACCNRPVAQPLALVCGGLSGEKGLRVGVFGSVVPHRYPSNNPNTNPTLIVS